MKIVNLLIILLVFLFPLSISAQTYRVEKMSVYNRGEWQPFVEPQGKRYFINKDGILYIIENNNPLEIKPKRVISQTEEEIVWEGIALQNLKVIITTTRKKGYNTILWIIDLEGSKSAYITYEIK